jgi:hypothetical protein
VQSLRAWGFDFCKFCEFSDLRRSLFFVVAGRCRPRWLRAPWQCSPCLSFLELRTLCAFHWLSGRVRARTPVKSVIAQCSSFSVPCFRSRSVCSAGTLQYRVFSAPVLLAPINAHPETKFARTAPIAGAAALVIFNLEFWNCLNQAIVCVNLIPSLLRESSIAEAAILP